MTPRPAQNEPLHRSHEHHVDDGTREANVPDHRAAQPPQGIDDSCIVRLLRGHQYPSATPPVS